MIKVITIDFWNTLFDSSGGVERNALRHNTIQNILSNFSVEIDLFEYNKALHASWDFFNDIWKNEYRTPSTPEVIDFFWKTLKLPFDLGAMEDAARIFSESILTFPPALIIGVKENLKILSENYRLAIVSDTGFSPGIILKKLLEENNISQYFSAFSFSDETGVSKPHPKAFLTILDSFDCPPEQAAHIGDIESTDIAGAKRLNMKAIRFLGDPTAVLNNDKKIETNADASAFSWNEIPGIISNFSFI